MRVELPNGVIIDGVPEGTSKHMVATKAIAKGLAKPEDFGYEGAPSAASESGGENFLAGIGSGLVGTGRRAANLLLPDSLTPDWASDEAIAEQSKLDEDLLETGAGTGGKVVGEIAATLPIGGAVGRGAGVLSKALRPTSKAGKYLANTMQRGAGRGAVEGATIGGVLADPGERGAGAAMGGAFGGVLGGAGTVLGKALGKSELIKLNKEAKRLQKMTGTFIPLSQSAERGMGRMVYNALLANFPGIGSKLRGQYQHAVDDLRRFIGENALPPHLGKMITKNDDVISMFTKLDDYWKTAFDDIKPLPITLFKNKTPKMPARLASRLKNEIGEGSVIVPEPGGGVVKAGDIIDLKAAIQANFSKYPQKVRREASKYLDDLDELMKASLNPTGKGTGQYAQYLHDYKQAQKYYPVWQTLQKISKTDRHFNPAQMARAEPLSGARPTAAVAGRLAKEGLEDFPSRQGLFQTAAALGLVGSGVGGTVAVGAGPTALAMLGAYGIGRAMVSKGLQKYLSGQTKFQRLNKALFRKYSDELQKLGMTARDAAVVLGAQDGT